MTDKPDPLEGLIESAIKRIRENMHPHPDLIRRELLEVRKLAIASEQERYSHEIQRLKSLYDGAMEELREVHDEREALENRVKLARDEALEEANKYVGDEILDWQERPPEQNVGLTPRAAVEMALRVVQSQIRALTQKEE